MTSTLCLGECPQRLFVTATRGEGSKNSEILWMAYPVILSSIERGEEQGTKGRSKREKHVEKNAALNE